MAGSIGGRLGSRLYHLTRGAEFLSAPFFHHFTLAPPTVDHFNQKAAWKEWAIAFLMAIIFLWGMYLVFH